MFTLYHNGNLFYTDTPEFGDTAKVLSSAKVSIAAGTAGSLEFVVPPSNAHYDTFTKLKSYIDLYRGSDLIFSGRVINEAKNFQGLSTVTCEGLLAVFNDSYFTPQVYSSITLSNLVTAMLTSHNSQVGSDKQISLGTMTVADDYVYRAYEDYELTIDRLKDLVDSYGGYMSVRKTNGALYLDWVDEFTTVSQQSIDFGENLIDLTQESSADEIITVLVPLGAEIEDSNGNRSRLTVESVNNGNVYIENATGIAEFGRVVGIQTWDDVTIPSNLLAKGTAYLADKIRSRVTINVKAVDMAKAGSSINYFKVGEKIQVSAALFGVNQQLVCMSQSLDLMNPAQNQMVLGDTQVGYVGKMQSEQSAINRTVNVINNNYASGDYVTNVNNTTMDAVNEVQNQLVSVNTEISNRIDEVEGSVTDAIVTAETYADGRIEEISSEFVRTDSEILLNFTNTIDDINNTFIFSTDGLEIRNANSRIYSVQDADSYEFIDDSTNTTVFRIDETGTTGLQANVTGQVGIGSGSVDAYTEQWAIRKGAFVNGVGFNLDVVWIGG